MYTDLYTIYQKNTTQLGFWITKKHWKNNVAQVLRIKGVSEGENVNESTNPDVVVMLMDIRTNEIQEIVEIANPQNPQFLKLDRDFEPKFHLPKNLMQVHNSLG